MPSTSRVTTPLAGPTTDPGIAVRMSSSVSLSLSSTFPVRATSSSVLNVSSPASGAWLAGVITRVALPATASVPSVT